MKQEKHIPIAATRCKGKNCNVLIIFPKGKSGYYYCSDKCKNSVKLN